MAGPGPVGEVRYGPEREEGGVLEDDGGYFALAGGEPLVVIRDDFLDRQGWFSDERYGTLCVGSLNRLLQSGPVFVHESG